MYEPVLIHTSRPARLPEQAISLNAPFNRKIHRTHRLHGRIRIYSTPRSAYTQINSAHTHTWRLFTLLVSRDSRRFVIVPCVSEASKRSSLGLTVLFPAVSLSKDQSPVKYDGILLACSARCGKGRVYQLSANTLTKTQSMQMRCLNTDPWGNLRGASHPSTEWIYFFCNSSVPLLESPVYS